MDNEMLLIVPSRGRPGNIRRLANALIDTEAKVDFVVGVDEDDEYLEFYKELEKEFNFILHVGPRLKFAGTVNAIATKYHKDYKYLSWMGDDHLPITKEWDKKYRDALDAAKVGVVYGNDLVMGKEIATELAFTSNIVSALGYAIPPGFVHLFVDNYFMKLGESIGKLSYLPDVIVQHLHPTTGNAEQDQTYLEANSPENWSNDRIRFEKYINDELPEDAAKLKGIEHA